MRLKYFFNSVSNIPNDIKNYFSPSSKVTHYDPMSIILFIETPSTLPYYSHTSSKLINKLNVHKIGHLRFTRVGTGK